MLLWSCTHSTPLIHTALALALRCVNIAQRSVSQYNNPTLIKFILTTMHWQNYLTSFITDLGNNIQMIILKLLSNIE